MDNQTSDTLFNITEIKEKITSSNTNMFITLIIVAVVVYLIYKYYVSKEHFAPGVFDQMYALDEQDLYLKNNINQTAGGNYNLAWNHPTRMANTSHMRGVNPSCLKESTLQPSLIPDAYVADY